MTSGGAGTKPRGLYRDGENAAVALNWIGSNVKTRFPWKQATV